MFALQPLQIVDDRIVIRGRKLGRHRTGRSPPRSGYVAAGESRCGAKRRAEELLARLPARQIRDTESCFLPRGYPLGFILDVLVETGEPVFELVGHPRIDDVGVLNLVVLGEDIGKIAANIRGGAAARSGNKRPGKVVEITVRPHRSDARYPLLLAQVIVHTPIDYVIVVAARKTAEEVVRNNSRVGWRRQELLIGLRDWRDIAGRNHVVGRHTILNPFEAVYTASGVRGS